MSKTIIIQKNGVAQTLSVDKLRIPQISGTPEDWLPADGKNLVSIEVKQNGTYKASDFGAYGIAEVKVACTLQGGSAISKAASKDITTLHNPAPAEGGRARVMSAHHLETPLDGGGVCQWVPENEVALGTKSINVDNKTYKAANDSKYGWSQVTVSGISLARDGDHIIHTDGSGTEVYTMPHRIRVEHGPLHSTYTDGETIDFSGMLVKAYNADGTVWTDSGHPDGVIPLDEMAYPKMVAHYTGDVFIDYNISGKTVYGIIVDRTYEKTADAPAFTGYYRNADYSGLDPGTMPRIEPFLISEAPEGVASNCQSIGTLQYKNKTVYYAQGAGYGEGISGYKWMYGPFCGYYEFGPEAIRRILNAYADFSSIPVQWARPGDGEVLTDYFTINVFPAEST